MVNDSLNAIASAIEAASSVQVLSHDRPDGDAIGSAVAMGLLLEQIGKSVQILNKDPVPDALRFLPGSDRVTPPDEPATADLVIALDSAGRDRISDTVWAVTDPTATLINIDHHISNQHYGDLNYVSGDSPATGELVYHLAVEAGWPLDAAMAQNLYAAISTDTGSFRYSSTSAMTMQVGGALIDLGVDPGEMNQHLYESYPIRRVEAMSFLLAGMKLSCESRCASVALPLAVSESLGLRQGDIEGVIDVIRAIDTVVVAVFFEELPNGQIRVSSRSKSETANVSQLCAHFGGGGHHLAAGARLPGPLEEAERIFLDKVSQLLTDQ